MRTATKKITAAAILTAAALVSFLMENLFPPLLIPGARLGISNVFILLAIITLGYKEGLIVLAAKIILGNVITGNLSALAYSLPAGAISIAVEILLLYYAKNVSVVAISLVGGAINLAVQNTVFCLITGGTEYFVYLPYLSLIGSLSGAFVGIAVYLLIKFVPKKVYYNYGTRRK